MDTSKKHPEFDSYWDQHKRLVWWMAYKIAKRLHVETKEIVGTLVIKFNMTLYTYNPDRSKFTTYFCKRCTHYVLLEWMIRESQSWAQFVRAVRDNKVDWLEESHRSYAAQIPNHLYRVPEDDESDVQAVLDCFDTAQDCWEFMTRYLNQRDKDIVACYFREDMTLQAIGDKFSITKERVRQLMERTKLHIRGRLKMVQALADLFVEKMEKEDQS